MNLLDLFCEYLMDDEVRQRLSEIIKKARGSRSQRKFAKDLGVSYAAIRSWEECESLPGLESMEKIASSMGMSLEELVIHIRGGKPLEKARIKVKAAEDALTVIDPVLNDLSKTEAVRLLQMLVQKVALSDGLENT